jgi:hypothetical protein
MTRAEYYQRFVDVWLENLIYQMNRGYSVDYVVSTARMLAHFGVTVLQSQETEGMSKTVVCPYDQQQCEYPRCIMSGTQRDPCCSPPIVDGKVVEENRCPCGVAGLDAHSCPYAVEIHNNSEFLCHCCIFCQRNCAMDI